MRSVRLSLLDMPGIDEEALDSLDAYLAEVIDQAHTAYKHSKATAKTDDFDWLKNQAAYWKHARGALKWLRGQINQARQARDRTGGGRRGDG